MLYFSEEMGELYSDSWSLNYGKLAMILLLDVIRMWAVLETYRRYQLVMAVTVKE